MSVQTIVRQHIRRKRMRIAWLSTLEEPPNCLHDWDVLINSTTGTPERYCGRCDAIQEGRVAIVK